jgi:predicted ATPase
MDVSNLLRQCGGVKVLATSRRRLDIYGEHEYALPPMSVPPPADNYSPCNINSYEAVQLFVTRARQHQPDFEVTSATATPVAQICQRMDGLPLALEIAAARLHDMPVDALAEALRQASGYSWLALLSWSVRDMPSRQRTLLNAITWSYTLLEPAQQDMIRQLSVFSGLFDLSAVAAVVDLPVMADEAELRATLNQLVDHNLISLVSRVPERWRLLEMIREFARTKLDPKATLIVGQRHANYYLARLTKLDIDSYAADDYLAEFSYEANDIRAALRFALGVTDANLAQQLVPAMGGHWESKRPLDESRRYLEAALDIGPS